MIKASATDRNFWETELRDPCIAEKLKQQNARKSEQARPEQAAELSAAEALVAAVDGDAGDPRADARRVTELGEVPVGLDEGVLDDVLHIGPVSEQARDQGGDAVHVAPVERLLGPAIAFEGKYEIQAQSSRAFQRPQPKQTAARRPIAR